MRTFEWEPEIEIIRFASADVITTSGLDWETEEDEVPPFVFG